MPESFPAPRVPGETSPSPEAMQLKVSKVARGDGEGTDFGNTSANFEVKYLRHDNLTGAGIESLMHHSHWSVYFLHPAD